MSPKSDELTWNDKFCIISHNNLTLMPLILLLEKNVGLIILNRPLQESYENLKLLWKNGN